MSAQHHEHLRYFWIAKTTVKENSVLETLEINPNQEPRLSVIWLHGLGADGHDFEGVVPYLGIPGSCPVRFIFPHAPHRSVTINMGMRMRAWYDILNPVLGAPVEDQTGIEESAELVAELIRRENERGLKTAQIVLAGFSQGGAIALHLGLRYAERLAGIMALSTYLPLQESMHSQLAEANRNTPILYLHGLLDPVIPIATAERSRQFLLNAGYDIDSRDFPIPHSVSPEEIAVIGNWLTARCASSTD